MLTRRFILLLISCSLLAAPCVFAQKIELFSPDKQIRVTLSIDSPRNSMAFYQVFYRQKQVIKPSVLGFHVGGQPTFSSFFTLVSAKQRQQRGSWKPVYGEKDNYPDNYNEVKIALKESILPNRLLTIVFRAYDEGIAFRYEFPDPKMTAFTLSRELTEFSFPPDTYVWEEYGHEGLYSKVLASAIKPNCELPLTFVTADSLYGAIAEGGSSDYPRAYVQSVAVRRNPNDSVSIALKNQPPPGPNTISVSLRGEAKGNTGYATSWRMITLADRPGGLIEQNYLLLNLNRPAAIKDASWIKPGTAIRDITLSTQGGKKYIDYAEKQGIDYIILDWGWYGPPNGENSDPSYVNVVNPGTGKPIPNHTGLDIKELVAYGKSKGVGIFLYVNRQGLERYRDKIFPLFKSWGIQGIKPGFINTGTQEWQRWTEELVKAAAQYNLMVDIHDAYRPTGLSRTYPNLLTQEGIRGNEHTPDADHTTTLPFTRNTIGAGDFTPGYCRGSLKNTWAHKLSLPVVFYSPGQFLFWGEPLTDCHNRPELAFWNGIPATWDDTKVLSGAIGEYIIIARRKGRDWYVGGITNHFQRTVQVNLDFLIPGKNYEATIYTDSADGKQISIEQKQVNPVMMLSFPLLPSGGFAIQIKEK